VSARRGLIAFMVVLVLGLAGLLVSGSSAHRVRAFALGVPNVGPAATLEPGRRACESPIAVPAAFGAVRVWASFVGAAGGLDATVLDAAGRRQLARGHAVVPRIGGALTATLNTTVAAGQGVTVCFRNTGPLAVNLLGSGPVDVHIRLTVAGKPSPLSLALVAFSPRKKTVLSEVPRMFQRAGLFRFSWIGTWTFWVLLAGVVVALGLCGAAVAAAGSDP
jgi:hypothetical protein